MAMLNIAWYLAEKGRTIILWDLDFEAPGLQDACLLQDGNNWVPPQIKGGFQGLINLFNDRALSKESLRECHCLGLGPCGRISLLAAGENPDGEYYRKFVQSFSWADFYADQGRNFVETMLNHYERAGYNYMFVDARTGLTDVADITTIHIPDLVVALTNLSDQSAIGIKAICERIDEVNRECKNNGTAKRRPERKDSPIEILLTGSPLPTGEWQERIKRINHIENKILGRPLDAAINYLPLLALGEKNQIFYQSLDGKAGHSVQLQFQAASDYKNLAKKIIKLNPEAPENLMQVGMRLINAGRWREALPYICTVQKTEQNALKFGKLYWRGSIARVRAILQGFDTENASAHLQQLKENNLPLLTDDLQQPNRKQELKSSYLLSKGIEDWFDGQTALEWVYILRAEFRKALDVANNSISLLEEAVLRCRNEQQRERLNSCLAFACLSAGQAAQYSDQNIAANSYYEKADRLYSSSLRNRPFEHINCLLSHAGNLLYTDDTKKTDSKIEKAKKIYKRLINLPSSLTEASMKSIEARCLFIQGEATQAIETLNSAFTTYKSESDTLGVMETSAERFRWIVSGGLTDDNKTSSLEHALTLFKNMQFFRKDKNAAELSRIIGYNVLASYEAKTDFSSFFKQQTKYHLKYYTEELDTDSLHLFNTFLYLMTGDPQKAMAEIMSISNLPLFRNALADHFLHEFLMLNGIVYFIARNNEHQQILNDYITQKKEKGFLLDALQALTIESLILASCEDNTWRDNLINTMTELEITRAVPGGKWAMFLAPLANSESFKNKLRELDLFTPFEKVCRTIGTL